ncbi:probable NADH dehydrogenase [Ptychodera flava]|uniref:probable NADH dehydrogenase n=1 Tax=Ptychodera flava TaxID=63121 RepID=UPI003969E784
MSIFRRIALSRFQTGIRNVSDQGRQRLVILGTGWGSYSVLKSINKVLYDVIVVSPRNHFLFTPLLASTTVGTLEFRSIIEPIRNTGFRETEHFHLSHAIGLDVNKKVLTCQSVIAPDNVYDIHYDRLVIGVGALPNTFGVPGVEEHAFFLKELNDARRIRNRILDNFELAIQPGVSNKERQQLLNIVIVGGGPTGVEFGAELYDFVKEDIARIYPSEIDDISVTLVEGNKILGNFDQRLQKYAEKKIRQRDKMRLIQSVVTEVYPNGVKLLDGTVLPAGLVVWSTGLSPRDFTKNLDLPKNKQGQFITDAYLRVKGDPHGCVFALGDCADIENKSLPCTAQVAERQGRYLANFLQTVESSPFEFKSMGMLAYIGKYEALTDMPGVKAQGFHSWLLWRSAYLTRLGSWRLRMQVPVDWLKTLLWGRDTSRF